MRWSKDYENTLSRIRVLDTRARKKNFYKRRMVFGLRECIVNARIIKYVVISNLKKYRKSLAQRNFERLVLLFKNRTYRVPASPKCVARLLGRTGAISVVGIINDHGL